MGPNIYSSLGFMEKMIWIIQFNPQKGIKIENLMVHLLGFHWYKKT